ncbi:MAG: Hsp20/alpha crystallin family protein [Firmicutes bacterium]|nr:Hsp20/alpha crystallin family protein [Bacillota bacterium]
MMFVPMLWNQDDDNEMLDLFDPEKTWRQMWNAFTGDGNRASAGMKTDIVEKDNAYELKTDLPGFEKDDIHVDLKDHVLTIRASHKADTQEKDEKSGRVLRRERSSANYERSFRVDEEIKPEDIQAKYENGVLSLTLPKKEVEAKADAARIEIH